MDISQTWPFVKLVLYAVLAVVLFRLCRRITRSWLRISLRSLASIVGAGCAMCLFLLALFTLSCTKSAPPIYSPDGRHVAILSYAFQGALGWDYAEVGVRSAWSPFARRAYYGVGSWDFKNNRPREPEVRWLDRSRLLIRYVEYPQEGQATCQTQVGEIRVVCENVYSSPAQ